MPGISAPWLGAPPVAIRMYFAVTFSPVIRRSVWASSSTARVFDDARARFLDIGGVDALEPRDLLVLVGDQRRPVEGDVRDGPAEAGGVLDLVVDVRADHEQLFRHAAADHAGAAHPVFFGDHDLGAVAGRDAGGANAARTTADDEQIDVELSHVNPARFASLLTLTYAPSPLARTRSDFLAALLHLGAELAVDGFGKVLRPLVHVGHAELDGAGLARRAASGRAATCRR